MRDSRTATISQARKWLVFVFAHGVLLSCVAACSSPPKTSEVQPVPISRSPSPAFPALALATPTPVQSNAAPSLPAVEEVAKAVARIFDKAAVIDESRAPFFLVGDFNGDGSNDLAVLTRPADASLPEINNELANWVLEDPHDVPIPGSTPTDRTTARKTVKAEPNDQLLTIIHGVGPQGWQNPEARQTYLLRNAAGRNPTVQTVANLRESLPKSNLNLRGDAISETINGHRGLIIWTGAKYGWAPQ